MKRYEKKRSALFMGKGWLFLPFLMLLPVLVWAATEPPAGPVEKNDYSNPENWLCRPGRQDACAVDLSTTVIAADGSLSREEWKADPQAPIDCFYVYPTVSLDPTPHSDMIPGPEERSVVQQQFARFASVCRPYAPLYRQITLPALRAALLGKPMKVDPTLNYRDILDAWRYYLDHDNQGRGVVLIGHSQGSLVLTQLIQKEIEGKPIQSRIVSALIIGSRVQVPPGKDVGGTFKHMPLCRQDEQIGCLVTFASFRSNVPPPPNSRFGKGQGETIAACNNPAALAGGSAPLKAYLSSSFRGESGEARPFPWVNPPKEITTPFVRLPGLLSSRCVANEHGSYLEVTVHGDPNDPRTDDIPGDVVVGGKVQADWGLHLIDMNLVMGDLLDLVRKQSRAYLAGKKR